MSARQLGEVIFWTTVYTCVFILGLMAGESLFELFKQLDIPNTLEGVVTVLCIGVFYAICVAWIMIGDLKDEH